MSTPCWHLPAARLEGRACVLARAALAGLLLIPASAAAQFNPWMTALFGALLVADLVPYGGALEQGAFDFDGSRWWWRRAAGKAEPLQLVRAGYAGPLLLALRLEGQGVRRDLLLWRWQCRREHWRRLSLASLHGKAGAVTG